VKTQTTNFETVDAAFAVDRRGVIILWNSTAEKMFDYSATQALGQRCWELLRGKDTYDNQYCCKFCPLREMAFHHEPVNEFHASFKSGSKERKQYSINCLTIFDSPENEQLLHICRPDLETPEVGDDVSANTPSTNILPVNGSGGALSQRETEVLKLLADGESTRKIASIMDIKTSTVRIHIGHVLLKLNVHKRREAVRQGRQLGLI
jgi:DNA-binding CsgD family transcriptional regulator